MRRSRPLLMAALVSLFLAEGQRAFFASLFGLGYEALFPTLRLVPAAVAAAFLLVLLAPLLPLARWMDRRGAVAVAAVGAAVFRLPMTHPALETRLVGGALVLACAATFLTWAVGYLDRRALAGGVVVGLVVDQLLRLGGSSYDLSLQPGWLPVQAVLSLALVAVVVLWARSPTSEAADEAERPAANGLERRAGGLRLRGALALGALLFIDLHVLGLPPVVSRWAGVSYELAGLMVGLAGAAALAGALLLARPTRGRLVTLALVALVAAAAVLGYLSTGVAVAVAMAAGHCAALLLVTRALDPASGRRSGGRVAAGFAVLVLATALYSLTFYSAYTLPALDGAAPWIFGAVGLLLAACFVLLPRPAEIPSPRAPAPTVLLVLGVAMAAVILTMAPGGEGNREVRDASVREGSVREGSVREGSDARIRVATWNLHYGYDESWRFDPHAMAETLERAGADLIALQEVPVGAPTAYGVDFPLWLGRRTGLRDHFSATINGLLGDAFLTSRERVRIEAVPLPAGGGDRKQLLRLVASVGGQPVSFNALHLGVRESARAPQLRQALARVGSGPAVVLGDLNAEAGDAVMELLTGAGFGDVFQDAISRPNTFPARDATRRIDWIWVRGFRVDSAAVLDDTPSDHRLVVATLHIQPRRIRSTEADDLQNP